MTGTVPPLGGSLTNNSQTGFPDLWAAKSKTFFFLAHDTKHGPSIHQTDFFCGSARKRKPYFLLLYAGRGGGPMGNPSVVLQRHDEDLNGLLHQLLPVVREEQVVVWDAIAHWIVGAHHVQQRGEQRQGVSAESMSAGHTRLRRILPPSHQFANHERFCAQGLKYTILCINIFADN